MKENQYFDKKAIIGAHFTALKQFFSLQQLLEKPLVTATTMLPHLIFIDKK